MRLQDLDDRVLPPAAARLRSAVDRVDGLRERCVSAYRGVDLAKIDDRFGRGPLATVRRAPQLGLVVAGLVLLAGLAVAVTRGAGVSGGSPAAQNDVVPRTPYGAAAVLGPKVGDSVRDYVRRAQRGLVAAVQESPDRPRVALVSMGAYRTPEEADALLSGFTVNRAFLRARAGGSQAGPLPLEVRGPFLPALRQAYVDTARTRAEAHKIYQSYVDTLKPLRAQDQRFRDLYEAFARSSEIEAQAYAHDCACVYSVVVTATPAQLLSLSARPGVRAVEVAAAGLVVSQVQVQPLLPEVVAVVPKPTLGSGT